MRFSSILRKENDDIFQLIFNHPFVQGIGKGDLSKEALTHYIKADYGYLTAFLQIYGIAISKSSSREEVAFFNRQIDFVLHGETEPHQNFCDVIDVDYEELQGYPLAPSADHFVKHMMYHAYTGSLGELIAAILPCPWTYFEVGKELMRTFEPAKDHPFYDWISFYADSSIEELEMRKKIDDIGKMASKHEKEKMKDAFRKSCQLELQFWEMAFTCEKWPGN